MDVEGVSHYLF